jgi:hypothetical protein
MKSTKVQYLSELQRVLGLNKSGQPVAIDSIPGLFRDDFNRFFMGETLQAWNGNIVIAPGKFHTWVDKIMVKGLDYVIELENS